MNRRPDPFDKRSMALSIGVHGGLLVLAWVLSLARPEPMEFVTIQVELVSPAPQQQAEVEQAATERLVVETPDPDPTPPPVAQEEDPVPIEVPDDPPPKPEPEPTPVQELAEEEETPATTTEAPPEDATESGEDINVRMEGLKRDFPVYYANIVRQIYRCFRPPRGVGDRRTVVFFYIGREGTVTGVDFVARSGSFDFDFSAMGAVECAGERGRFGPLPDDMPYDRLPIQFEFKPGRVPLGFFPGTGRPAEDR